jgi:hypothetical protein
MAHQVFHRVSVGSAVGVRDGMSMTMSMFIAHLALFVGKRHNRTIDFLIHALLCPFANQASSESAFPVRSDESRVRVTFPTRPTVRVCSRGACDEGVGDSFPAQW